MPAIAQFAPTGAVTASSLYGDVAVAAQHSVLCSGVGIRCGPHVGAASQQHRGAAVPRAGFRPRRPTRRQPATAGWSSGRRLRTARASARTFRCAARPRPREIVAGRLRVSEGPGLRPLGVVPRVISGENVPAARQFHPLRHTERSSRRPVAERVTAHDMYVDGTSASHSCQGARQRGAHSALSIRGTSHPPLRKRLPSGQPDRKHTGGNHLSVASPASVRELKGIRRGPDILPVGLHVEPAGRVRCRPCSSGRAYAIGPPGGRQRA